jgi:hypothetical protein
MNWTLSTLPPQRVLSVLANGSDVYAGTAYAGVYYSSNNGTNWTQTSLNNRYITSLAVNGIAVYAGTAVYGLYVSTNAGNNWTQTLLNNRDINSILINGSNVYAGTNNYGIYISTNNGASWTQNNLNNVTVYSLTSSGTNIFCGTSAGVYLTTNGGNNWIQKNQGFIYAPNITSLMISNNYIIAGTVVFSGWKRSLAEIIGIQKISTEVPTSFSLLQNYPNPFNPCTVIGFQLSVAGKVSLKVYDMLGREVATLVNEQLAPGTYEVNFDAHKGGSSTSALSSGMYFYTLSAGEYKETKRMTLLK